MSQLDSREFLRKLDPSDMIGLTEAFPDQCRKALEISRGVEVNLDSAGFSQVILTGLGGSAAGGDFVHSLFEAHGNVPFSVNRDYHLPHSVNDRTLIIAVSYSGNTEETLSAFAEAKAKGAQVVAITSGGELAKQARAHGDLVIEVPGGQPPRTALGLLLIPTLDLCVRAGLLPTLDFETTFAVLDQCVEEWGVAAPHANNPAKDVAVSLFSRMGVLYGLGGWQGRIASRWRSQLNENAKVLCLVHTYPELCHNEILGWVKADDQGVASYQGILLLDGTESAKMKKRAEVVEQLVGQVCPFTHVHAKGDHLLSKMLSLAFFGDFVSIYLAALNAVDPENIDHINVLKKELAGVE